MSKKYTTNFLEDTNGSTGSANQVLVSTAAGVDWVDGSGSGIIGGPYLPLIGGTLTGNLTISVPDGGSAPAMTNTLFMKGYEGRGIGMKIRDSANSATSPNNREWFVGSGYSNSGFNIGYSSTGSNSSYSAQSKFNITTGGVVTIPGNVGIGNTSPDAKLDVNGAGNFSGGTVVSGIDTNTSVGVAIGKGKYLYSNDGNYLRKLIGQQSGGSIDIGQQGTGLISNINFFPGTSGNIDFFGSGSIDMRVASSGNVGIGTTAPSQKLEVNGNIQLTNKANSILFGSAGANGTWGAPKISRIDNSIIISDYNGVQLGGYDGSSYGARVTIKGTGNVGIGYTSPNAKLAVNGDFGIQGQLFTNTGTGVASGAGVANGFAIPYRTGVTTLNNNYNYIVRLTTTGTGTDTGSYYLVGYDVATTSFYTRMVSRGGSGSNHPELAISGNTMVAYDNHVSGYTIRWSCETIGTGDPDGTLHNMGSDYQWQRNVNDLYYTDGDVGIGTTNPNTKLNVNGGIKIEGTNSLSFGGTTSIPAWGINSSGNDLIINDQATTVGDVLFTNAGNVGIATTSPRDKLDVVGTAYIDNLRVGFTGSPSPATSFFGTRGTFYNNAFQTNYMMHCVSSATNLGFTRGPSNSNPLTFNAGDRTGATNSIGSITLTSAGTSYNTTSDYRLKENEEKISNAIDRLKNLKPIRFNWISEPEEEKVDGFLAHEVAEVVPEAVTGEKDAIDYKGDDDLQMLENSKLVPLLTAALQQAIDKIELLEQRIQSIENK